jgi:hypothetical protein
MALAILKVSKHQHPTDETTHRETGDETVSPVVAIDPRPLPAIHVRRLDVNKVLERALPRVLAASRSFSRD